MKQISREVYYKIPSAYKITCLTNGKKYIGSTSNLYRRCVNHRSDLKTGKHRNPYLQEEYNKFGPDQFVFEAVGKCNDVEAARKLEAICLEYYEQSGKFSQLYNEICHKGLSSQGMKEKLSEASSKPVRATHIVTGEIYEFGSATKAIEAGIGKDKGNISAACNGKLRKHNGYRWELI